MDTALSIILGGVITVVVTMIVEFVRRPKLSIRIITPADVTYNEPRPAQRAKYLLIEVQNQPLSGGFRWMARNVATQCKAEAAFYHIDGQDVFARKLLLRWSSAPEPVPVQIIVGDQRGVILDRGRFQKDQRIDLIPGESDSLSLVVKLDEEDTCWGWGNESYATEPRWRNERWKLEPQRYLAEVTVYSAGAFAKGTYRIINDVNIDAFRLEKASKEDVKAIARRKLLISRT